MCEKGSACYTNVIKSNAWLTPMTEFNQFYWMRGGWTAKIRAHKLVQLNYGHETKQVWSSYLKPSTLIKINHTYICMLAN